MDFSWNLSGIRRARGAGKKGIMGIGEKAFHREGDTVVDEIAFLAKLCSR